VVSEHFDQWDLNHDGRLETSEIDQLMNRHAIKGEAAAALAVLKQRERHTPARDRLQFALTAADLGHFDAQAGEGVATDIARGSARPFHAESHFQKNLKMVESLVPRLFAGDGPNFQAMKQGPIGDCYFFCLAGYLAARQPARIRQMIEVEPSGNYLVHFLDGETYPVAAPTEAELIVNNSGSSLADGTWLCVLEKAVGERMRQTTRKAEKRTAEATDAMAAGGSTGTVIRLFSGHTARTITLRDAREAAIRMREIRRELPIALAHDRLASVEMNNPPRGQAKVPGLGYHHAYAILAYDSATDSVTVWNPWGQHFEPKGPEGPTHGFATRHGVFQVPVSTLYHQFSTVHIETTEPASPGVHTRLISPRRR
jgi:hypothetical protein